MLTDTRIRSAKPGTKPYKITDAKGLYVLVAPNGAKAWRYRFELGGSESTFGIGAYCVPPSKETEDEATVRRAGGKFTLAEARAEREKARALVKQGINPATQRKHDALVAADARSQTFKAVALEWVDNRATVKGWEPITRARRVNLLERLAFPRIGSLSMCEVTSAHVFDLLKRALTNGPAVKEELQRTLQGVFALALSTGRADRDMAAPVVAGGQLPTHRSEHKRALTVDEVGSVLRDMAAYNSGMFQVPAAFRLMWLTLARPSEACEAQWAHIDLDKALWTVPPGNMKARREHVVPLPTQAVNMLRGLHALTGHRQFVFPNRDDPRRPMSTHSMRHALRSIGWAGKFTPHAARTTGSTLLHGMGYVSDWIERQLAHADTNGVRATYNHAAYLPERANMMQRWSDLLDTWQAGGKVKPIRTAHGLAVAA
jgi:integrase